MLAEPSNTGRTSVLFVCLGNICRSPLAEGIFRGLRDSFMEGPITKFAGLLAKPALKRFKKKLDYAEYGGAPLLGVKGVSIIGHGRSDQRAVRNAIRAALRAAEHNLHEHIQERVALLLPQD